MLHDSLLQLLVGIQRGVVRKKAPQYSNMRNQVSKILFSVAAESKGTGVLFV